MAQAITNTVKSTNPFAGLLGLTPQPKAPATQFGMQTSTPSLIKPPTSSFNLGTTPAPFNASNFNVGTGQKSSPLAMGSLNLQPAPGQTAPVTPVASGAPQYNASSSAPVGMTTPSGMPVTGNPATFGGAPQQTGVTQGLFPSVVSSLAGMTKPYTDLAAKAGQIGDQYGQAIADVGGQGARFQAGQLTTGTTPVAEGNAAVTARTTAAQQTALAQGEQAALQGVSTGITANQGAASALSSAGNLAQPSPAAFGQTVFDPTTGQYSGGGGLPAEVMQQYAQMASSGQYSAIPSFITSNPVLNAQLNVAAKALNPNYTPVGAQGASGVLAGIPALTSANTAAEGIKNTIVSYLGANPQLNPSDLAAGNLLQQWIQGKQLTDPKYQTLFNYLNEYTNTLAPILGVGGDATNLKTQIAQGFVNAAASGQSISQVLSAMSQLATNKIQDLSSGATGGGTSVPNPTTAGTGGYQEVW